MLDLETRQRFEVTPAYAQHEYQAKLNHHLADLKQRCAASGLDYFLLPADRPLDHALREYLTLRHHRN